jgi:hypothetical protein
MLLYHEGDARAAAVMLDETTAMARAGQYKPDLARSLVALGRVKLMQDEVGVASELIREGLALFLELGHKLGMVIALEQLAAVSVIEGDVVRAVKLFVTANSMRAVMGTPLPPIDRPAYDSVISMIRGKLGEAAFAETWAQAAARPFMEVVEELLNTNEGLERARTLGE